MTDPDKRATLAYVRDMLQQLKVVCGHGGKSHLVYLLDMARLQAIDEIAALEAGGDGPEAEEERR